ncbi:acyl-CoA dehydrogenase family protein [Rhodococcus sp. BP-349]|jgi:alkylation response protein AidB-like acyl-CoA dehydrogenase|uniref:Alkylation response protein AidB-like acyl-CoA dehydrogenase n=1 Tax=Rhodococcoides corynebacterioides TaxID=53972 RepID=A0ABS2KZQ7_9NOCA|nr:MULTISPECIES: acyl-CoA dehydrogenase family protein [Rhodococcus]MBM7417413.1 alkylation response protein AidB-like acyl-CoA dehydrogenase [Rhodococcus corynebacterioides]MBP1115667.1 alkylation response protein AidB-like acyl-CoA dehydrogenase [Rhodococcus sp. PvP016]MBY6537709.1 acyl-CoA dehydrogenase family protein [Rhodococcus sp. BP-363]MBY6542046.1 acyl-CoA dehydrogenase family protein [Rhodococcus sp. BP-369]MBY6561276.1 acyl-CoA dehydrogenase family protein [Rhodococcus sp. BP-370]
MPSAFVPAGLTDDHVQLRKLVRDFVNARVIPTASEREAKDEYPDDLIPELADLGLFGITVSEEYGGSDLDYVSYGLIFEELARGWMALASLVYTTSSGGYLISEFGTEDQKNRFLPDMAAGRRMSGIALTEPSTGSDLKKITLSARRDGDNYIVNGSKIFITHARHANPLVTLVKTDPTIEPAHRGGISQLLVEQDTPGLSYGSDYKKLGHRGLELCEVNFDNAVVPAANLLGGEEGKGFYQMMAALDRGRIYMAAASTGMSRAALEHSVEYVKQRETFGKKLSEHQAVQMRLADMATKVEASRLLYLNAALKTDADGRASAESGMAKIFATESAMEVTYDAIRLHGGYGYIKEFPLERYMRDAALMPIGEGANEMLRMIVAKELTAK